MNTNPKANTRQTSLAGSPISTVSRSPTLGLFGGLMFILWDNSARKAISQTPIVALIALLAFTALVVSARYALRSRARRRWRAVLDCYTAQEEKKITNSRSNLQARPQP